MSRLSEYGDKYSSAQLKRENGLLEITLHTNGGPLVYNLTVYDEWTSLWNNIARDDENRVVLITGAGGAFIPRVDRYGKDASGKSARKYSPIAFHPLLRDGIRHITDLLSIPVPMIAAINGHARIHPEPALLSDIVLATPDTVIQDQHFLEQQVPGDGMHVLMPMLLGKIRGAYFLYTGQKITGDEALRLGLVNEVHEHAKLLPRAREIARALLRQPDHNLRYMRMLMTHEVKKKMHELIGLGLAVEGLAACSSDWSNWTSPPE